MASLGFVHDNNKITWTCGGSLISDQYVLTAAHCFLPQYGHLKYVRLGELNFESDFDEAQPENFEVAEIILHPFNTPVSFYNDIALIKLNQSVKLNPYLRPACLPAIDEPLAQYAIATGWGKPEIDEKQSSHLIKVTLENFSYDQCSVPYANFKISKETQICYGSAEDGRSTCAGDSGGPLQTFHSKMYCMYTIIGITSFGIACGTKGVPGIFTKVSEYIDWVEGIVWKDN